MVGKAYGWFDYVFTQVDNERSTFSVLFFSNNGERGKARREIAGSINYNRDGEMVTDKIVMSKDADLQRALPAKPGYIFMMEYYRKEKRMDVRLEKINQ